jgi:hypothetical protein
MLSSRSKLILAVLFFVASIAFARQRVLDSTTAPEVSSLDLAVGYSAIATGTALLALGVDELRMKGASYGKEKPFCADNTDSCLQSKRRAQFVRDPTVLSLDSSPGNQ